jgi:hypothetical protein
MLNFEKASRYLTANAPEELKILLSNAVELENEKKECKKQELLGFAAQREPKFYTKFETWIDFNPDKYCEPDPDGDYIAAGGGWELMSNNNEGVIVHIHETVKPEDALRILEKKRERIKRSPYLFADISKRSRNSSLDSASRNVKK